MDYFKENKNLINKILSVYNRYVPKSEFRSDFNVYLNTGVRVQFRFTFKPSNIVIVQKGKYLYFCTRYKKTGAVLHMRYNGLSNPFEEEVLFAFADSAPWVDSLEIQIRDYLKQNKSKFPSLASVDLDTSISKYDLARTVKDDPDTIRNCSAFKEFEKACKDIKDCDIQVLMYDDVFKNISERDLVPISYINEDTDLIFVPRRTARGKYKRTSNNFFNSLSVKDPDLTESIRAFITNAPITDWCYLEFDSEYVSKSQTKNFGGWW